MTNARTKYRCIDKRSLFAGLCLAVALLAGHQARAESRDELPAPLDPATVVRIAHARRPEIASAQARATAASERPKIVSALPDPVLMVQADLIPISFAGVNGSVTVQQELPLSRIRGNRGRAAEAEASQFKEEVRRTSLDVELEALAAYFMVAERRETDGILNEQIAIVEQLARLARAHLAAGQGMQADVLRLDNERARVDTDREALAADIRSAEAMLDTALARPLDAPVPPLAWTDELNAPPALADLLQRGLDRRPELAAARATRTRALAEVDVMRSMYAPMALVRAGPAYSIDDGAGAMVMVGLSIPIWRERLGSGVAEAEAMAAMTSADIDAVQRMIGGSIASARETVIANQTRLLALRTDILPRAHLVVESAIASFGAGQGSMLAVLDASRDLRDVRMQEVMVRARLGTAWARLRRETGELDR
jgi:outer membrane protein TolC